MSFDIFRKYGLDKIHDSLTEDHDYKDTPSWTFVKKKDVRDADGFLTDYAWYTDGEKHIFMFGDVDVYEPDEDYADWVTETEHEAEEWFDNYHGFEQEDAWSNFHDDDYDDNYTGNANFMNDGFDRVYGNGSDLED